MAIAGRAVVLAVTADDEVDLLRGMIDLLRPHLDRVVVAEGTRTFHGRPREVIGPRWQDHLELGPDELVTVTIDLPPASTSEAGQRTREVMQRAALNLGLRDLDGEDLFIGVDVDEYVDPAWLLSHAATLDEPVRLKLLPLYGGLDRRAADWHCCASHLQHSPGFWPPTGHDWLFPGGFIAPVAALEGRGPVYWRANARGPASGPAGWHLLHLLAADPAHKLARQAHTWDARVDTGWMRRALELGVHPYGWWAASAIPVPEALRPLLRDHPEAELGPLPGEDARREFMQEALERFGS